MELIFAGIGFVVLVGIGWVLHRRFGAEPPQVHSNVKPLNTHDPDPLVGQGQEGQGIL